MANSLNQCTTLAAANCLDSADAAQATSAAKYHMVSTTGKCVVLRDDQCFKSDAAVIVNGCKNARKTDGTCVDLTAKTKCLETDALKSVAAGTKERLNTSGQCVTLTKTDCLDPVTGTKQTVSTAAPFT